MFTVARKRVLMPYLALGFSAVLSLIAIVAIISLTALNGPGSDGWAIAFLVFLPMCFYFMGLATAQTQTELQELRQQLATLTAQQQPKSPENAYGSRQD